MELIRCALLLLVLLSPAAHAAPDGAPTQPSLAVASLALVPLAAPAIAVDLQASTGWPGRALDPVLTVGGQRFTAYTHPAPGVLRFTVEDAALLVPGTQAWLQYGEDVSSRIDLTVLLAQAQR